MIEQDRAHPLLCPLHTLSLSFCPLRSVTLSITAYGTSLKQQTTKTKTNCQHTPTSP